MNMPNQEVVEITGSNADYYANMGSAGYAARINTPAKNPYYFELFHLPVIENAFDRSVGPKIITLLDIACGPAFELGFVKDHPAIDIIATDISPDIMPEVRDRLGSRALVFASDASHRATQTEVADVGMIVNAMIYVPDKMLESMAAALKPAGECVVNFRNFSNPYNKDFYDYYTQRGGVILDRKIETGIDEDRKHTFEVKVLDYTECVDDEGKPDTVIRQLGQQLYFTSREDMTRMIESTGLAIVSRKSFDFSSPVNSHNQIDVFTLQKETA
jgi:hypothetical protein